MFKPGEVIFTLSLTNFISAEETVLKLGIFYVWSLLAFKHSHSNHFSSYLTNWFICLILLLKIQWRFKKIPTFDHDEKGTLICIFWPICAVTMDRCIPNSKCISRLTGTVRWNGHIRVIWTNYWHPCHISLSVIFVICFFNLTVRTLCYWACYICDVQKMSKVEGRKNDLRLE